MIESSSGNVGEPGKQYSWRVVEMAQVLMRSVSTVVKRTGLPVRSSASISPVIWTALGVPASPVAKSPDLPQQKRRPSVSTAQVRSAPADTDWNLQTSPGLQTIGTGSELQATVRAPTVQVADVLARSWPELLSPQQRMSLSIVNAQVCVRPTATLRYGPRVSLGFWCEHTTSRRHASRAS